MMIYKINLIGKYDKKQIDKIQKEHKEQVEGIYEIYDNLYVAGYSESYSKERIFYVAYTLAKYNIEFELKEIN